MVAFGDGGGDGRDLAGRLAQPEDDLGKALAGRPVMVDLGEPEVGQGFGPQRPQEGLVGLGRRPRAGLDFIKHLSQLFGAHGEEFGNGWALVGVMGIE